MPPARARDRFAELAKSGVVSKQDLLDAQATADAARRPAAERARAALAAAQFNLQFTEVRAPITGRIGRSIVTTGALVTSGQAAPLTTIQRLDPIFVDIQQSSAALLAFRRQLGGGELTRSSTEVNLMLEDGSRYAHSGVLQFAESVVDPATGTVTVRARFPNPEGLLLPGMYVRAEFAPVEMRAGDPGAAAGHLARREGQRHRHGDQRRIPTPSCARSPRSARWATSGWCRAASRRATA